MGYETCHMITLFEMTYLTYGEELTPPPHD